MDHPTRILLVRHGGTTATADDRFAGSSDVLLSESGIEQARRLGERLKDVRIDAAYCSNLTRAIDTSAQITRLHPGLSATVAPALREIDHGHWEGMRHKEVERRFANEYAAWTFDPLDYCIPGGESGRSVLKRASSEVQRIISAHPGQTVLIVSHKATNRLLLAHWLGFDPRTYRQRLAQDTCCLNIILFGAVGDGGAFVVLVNDTSHYQQVQSA
jgi:probable phosphoglycerate mutase